MPAPNVAKCTPSEETSVEERPTPCGWRRSRLHETKKYAPSWWISHAIAPTNPAARTTLDTTHFRQRGQPASGPRQVAPVPRLFVSAAPCRSACQTWELLRVAKFPAHRGGKTSAGLDPAIPRIRERIDAERDQSGGDSAEQGRAVGRAGELRERPVEPDCIVRVELDRRLDEEDTHETEDDCARDIASDSDRLEHPPDRRIHLARLRVFEEVATEAAVGLVAADPDEDNPRSPDQPGARGPAEHARRRLVQCARAEQDVDRQRAETRVRDPAPQRRDPVGAAVGAFGPVPERRAEQPPECIAGERDCDEQEQRMPERLVCDRAQRTLLIGGGPAAADREFPREDAEDDVDQPARDEAGSREPLEATALHDGLRAASNAGHGSRLPVHEQAVEGAEQTARAS